MGRIAKQKRILIEEANKRLLGEQGVITDVASRIGSTIGDKLSKSFETVADDIEDSLADDSRYSDYGTDVITVANEFSGGGYAWGKGAGQGTCLPLYHDGNLIRNCDKGGTTHCCGFTLSVAFIVATNRGLLTGKSLSDVKGFSSDWYGAGGAGCGKLCVTALEDIGIGYEVSLEEAQKGDFCQIWRTNGSGHSVIFKSHIYEGDEIIGFKYRSSQKSTDGIGEPEDGEQFSDSGGSMKRDCTFFGRMNP